MRDKNTDKKLITVIQQLYCKISLLVAENRRMAYHPLTARKSGLKITDVINRTIISYSELYRTNKDKVTPDSDKNFSNWEHDNLSNSETDHHYDSEPNNIAGSEFTKYLKRRRPSELNPSHMGDTLKESVFEHIHSAIRCARQGDSEKSKLHAVIAGNAIEEAGHFLSDDEYTELIHQVEHYFAMHKPGSS